MLQNCIKIRKQNESDTRVRKMCPRKEAQYISWDLIAASCPHYRSYCLHLSKAPSVTGSLHPVTSPSHSNPTKKHNTDTDWGCADFKMRRNRSTGRRSVRGFCTADVQYGVRTLIRSAFLLADNVAQETSDLAQQTRAQHPFGLASETLRNRAGIKLLWRLQSLRGEITPAPSKFESSRPAHSWLVYNRFWLIFPPAPLASQAKSQNNHFLTWLMACSKQWYMPSKDGGASWKLYQDLWLSRGFEVRGKNLLEQQILSLFPCI